MDNIEVQREYLSKFKGGEVTLHFSHNNEIAYLCLKRSEKKNAMTGSMMVQLREKIEELEEETLLKGLIFYGEGNFCSGGDLDFARESGNPSGAFIMNAWMTTTLRKLRNLKLITVCVASGPTLGGGAEMSSYCDYILVTPDVKFGFVHAKLGIIPAWGGGTSLVQKVGYKIAMDLMLTAKILSADDCLHAGLADGKISSLEEAKQWLKGKIRNDVSIVKAIKEVCLNANTMTLDDSTRCEQKIFLPFWGSKLNKHCLEKRIKHLK